MCNKIRFNSKTEAKEYYRIKFTRKPTRSKLKPGSIRAYECPDCNGWHLTTKKKHKAHKNK